MPLKLLNFLLFYLGWFCAVLGAAGETPLLGPAVTIPIVGWHLYAAKQPRQEATLLLLVALIGASFDQALVSLNLVQYRGATQALLPLWMVGLWLQFGTTLNVSLRWMREKVAVAAVLGLLGGPAAYWSGVKLGATLYIEPQWTLTLAAIGWAIVTPTLMMLAKRFDGYSRNHSES